MELILVRGVCRSLVLHRELSMARAPKIRRREQVESPGYPTLAEHRASRREFLLSSLAGLGAGALGLGGLGGCEGSAMPGDNHPGTNINSGNAPPAYYDYIYFPETGDRASVLTDGFTLRFYVVTVCTASSCADYGVDYRTTLTDKLAAALMAYSSANFATPAGVFAVADALRALLNASYNDDNGTPGYECFTALDLYVVELVAP
jgi:hypothetical protein